MTLFHMSIAFLTVGFGAEIARLLASRLDFVPEGVLTLICIIASSFLIWPVYRLFRLMPPLPGCPNGHGVHWARTANQGEFPAWSCRTCGLRIVHRGFQMDVSDQGSAGSYTIVKKHPYWLNGWRRMTATERSQN
jgi:ribosome modulation factor